MIIQIADPVWLDDTGVCSVEELAEASGLSVEELDDLIRNGVIAAVDDNARPPNYLLHNVITARLARRLRDDFELDPHGVALALTLMRHIDEIEGELTAARVKLRRTIYGSSG